MATYQKWNSDLATEIIKSHSGRDGALLPILHELQATFGYIAEPAVPMMAEALSLYRLLVHRGHSEVDTSGIFKLYEKEEGK